MTRFEDALVDLLLQHSCVIVPGFGGFVSQTNSAKVDWSKGVILPPKKSLLFNRQLVNNDGLLINYISEKREISYPESEEMVAIKVSDWKTKLHSGQRIELDRIGNLFLDSERNIQFEQDRFTNLLLESYGLEKIHFIGEDELQIVQHKAKEAAPEASPILDFAPSEIIKKEPESEPEVVEAPTSKLRSIVWKAAAAAVLVPIAFYSYWIPMETKVLESGIISLKDFNPNYTADEGTYDAATLKLELAAKESIQTLDEKIAQLPKQVEVYYYPYDEGMFIPVKLEEEMESQPVQTIPMPSEESNSSFIGSWIVGSFSTKENAMTLQKELQQKGLNPSISTLANGMLRVSAAKIESKAHLQQVQTQTEALGLEGWLLKF